MYFAFSANVFKDVELRFNLQSKNGRVQWRTKEDINIIIVKWKSIRQIITLELLSLCSQSTILRKIFWEKLRNQGKLDKPETHFLRIFWTPMPNIYYRRGEWVCGFGILLKFAFFLIF